MSEVAELKRKIRDLESRDPLRNNSVLILAVERALQLLMIRKYGAINKTKSRLLKDSEYVRRFIALALDPSVTRAEMRRKLRVSKCTLDKHLAMFTGYLNDFLTESPGLRTSDVGYGWANDYDLEEQ